MDGICHGARKSELIQKGELLGASSILLFSDGRVKVIINDVTAHGRMSSIFGFKFYWDNGEVWRRWLHSACKPSLSPLSAARSVRAAAKRSSKCHIAFVEIDVNPPVILDLHVLLHLLSL